MSKDMDLDTLSHWGNYEGVVPGEELATHTNNTKQV